VLSSVLHCKRQWYGRAIMLLAVLPLAGCLASAPGSGSTPTPTLIVSPATANVSGGALQVFTATSSPTGAAVEWSLGGTSGTTCGNPPTSLGSLTCGPGLNQVTYLAPATPPSPNTAQITATLVSNSSVSSSAKVTLGPSDVGITLSPATASIAVGATTPLAFTATLTGTTYEEVGWEVNGQPNGTLETGTIAWVPATQQYSPSVTYTAPATVPSGVTSVTITATAVADMTKSASATITFSSSTPPPPVISVSPATATVTAGGQQQFTANVTGQTNPAVTWTVVGGSSYGTITAGTPSTTATYTAPATAPASGTVTIMAQLQGTTASGSSVVTVTQPVVNVTLLPATVTVASGGTQLFTATVTGTTNQALNWTVVGGANNGTIVSSPPNSLTATYTAPTIQTGASNQTITVAAQSQANTAVQGNATVTVQAPGSLVISPQAPSIPVGGTQQFTTTQSGVTWSVAATGCTATNIGSINSSSGLYTAPPTSAVLPASPCPVEVTATAPGATGSTLANLHVVVSITNLTSSPNTIGVGANWLYTAGVNGASSVNQGVNWTATTTSGGSCPDAGLFPSSVSPYTDPNGGFYYAPTCLPSAPVTIVATSAFDETQSQSTSVTVQQFDPAGSATVTSTGTSCPTGIGGTTGASCYTLDVSCPGVADWPNTYLKVNKPTGTSLGTVILGTGSGGNYVYDNDTPDFFYTDTGGDSVNGGLGVVNGILAAGYTTVQVAFSPLNNPTQFPNGWLTGPGGVRRLACRYASVAQWVYTNIQKSTSVPMCATGNSGGAGAIGYAVTTYGESNIFSMVETTSGPPMTRLDWACSSQSMMADFACNSLPTETLPFNFSLSEAEIIDPAYPAGEAFCSNAVSGTGTQAPGNLFLSDSILGGAQPTPTVDPPTYVNIVLGGADTTAAVQQGQHWGPAVGDSAKVCVTDAPHAIPAAPSGDGVTQIVNDIQTLCKLQ
jgi:hypothetical protein